MRKKEEINEKTTMKIKCHRSSSGETEIGKPPKSGKRLIIKAHENDS